jgi:ubiquinone/menaquinone biosynthesis C-methylase UbiE
MARDPYRRIAGLYDWIFKPMNRGLRLIGLRLFLPREGSAILDIGCGTGTQLEMYRRYSHNLHGIDTSPSMLQSARARLAEAADLELADGTHLPYEAGTFDFVLCMLALHEMDGEDRRRVIAEIKRVLKGDGHILLIDFHAGRPFPIQGWLTKLVILLAEMSAGGRHFRNYRNFVATGGLPTLIEGGQLTVERRKVVGGGTLALYLLGPSRDMATPTGLPRRDESSRQA